MFLNFPTKALHFNFKGQYDQLVGRLGGWLVGLVLGWSVGWLVGRLGG